MPSRLGSLIALAYCLLPTASSHAQVIVDSFSDGLFSITISPASAQSAYATQSGDPSQIFSGERVTILDIEQNPALPHSTLSIQSGTGYMDYNRNQNGTLSLDYGVYASSPVNVNFQAGGNDRLALNVLAAPGPFQLTVTAIDNAFFGSNEASANLSGSGPGLYEVPFTSFGAVEWDKIGGVKIDMPKGTPPNLNGPGLYRFDYFSAVPEPNSIVFVSGLGLTAFALCIRRKRS